MLNRPRLNIGQCPTLANPRPSSMMSIFSITAALSPRRIPDMVLPSYTGIILMASNATVAATIVTFRLNTVTGLFCLSSVFRRNFSISSGQVVAGSCFRSSTSLHITVATCPNISTPVVANAATSNPSDVCADRSHTNIPASTASAASVSHSALTFRLNWLPPRFLCRGSRRSSL